MSRRINRRHRYGSRAGFSLMEILVVLAILALSTAIIMPSTARMLDQTTAHAVFFEFQRQASDLRREANRTGQALRVLDPAVYEQTDPDPALDRQIILRAPWTFSLSPSLEIAEGGLCNRTSVVLMKQEEVVMRLRTDDGTCRFVRYQTTVNESLD